MANVQTIPVKELESIYAHYSKKNVRGFRSA